MTNTSSYQPFLIGDGKATTGLFTYLESWVKPADAFDQIENAFIYRGSLYQRNGIVLFPSTPQAGALTYTNNEIIATGSGTNTRTGTLAKFPLILGSVTITAKTSAGNETFTDVAMNGILVGSLGDAGTIDYTTGAWTLTASGGRTFSNNIPIVGKYNFVPVSLTTPVNNPIMGIKTFINETDDSKVIVVLDTRRANYYNTTTATLTPIQTFSQLIYETQDAITATTGTLDTHFLRIAPFSVTVEVIDANGTVITTATDIPGTYPNGVFSAGNISTSTIQYALGTLVINFTVPPAKGVFVKITASLQDDYFTGDNSNFFNATNWRPNDQQSAYLYLTNNKDFITLYDGVNLSRPSFGITVNHVLLFINDIATTLDIHVFENRLLLFRPTLVGLAHPEAQWVYYSAELLPFNMAQDISGNGGAQSAATSDWIQSAQSLRDALIIFFTDTTWLLRFTENVFDPFRFIQINSSRSTNAPYGSVDYDQRCTAMGAKGLIFCDGVNVDRYDVSVIDLWEDINQTKFQQCFAEKFDSLNQTWMLYPSMEEDNSTSDSAIIYNFLEDTWAVFIHNMGALVQDITKKNTLSCLGLGYTTKDITWADFGPGGRFPDYTWSQATWVWSAYLDQDLSPLLLGGDQNGYVYELNIGPTDNAGPNQILPIKTSIITKSFNPFVSQGEKGRFGYLDVYYEVNANVQVAFNFRLNGSEHVVKTEIITLDSPDPLMEMAWKRIYVNLTGQFVQWEISSLLGYDKTVDPPEPIYNTTGTFKILGQILYAAPAGRLTPGLFT